MRPYRNRADAGRALAELLADYKKRSDVVVMALPRGGVPVAYEVAQSLGAPLDVFLVRKLGVPGMEELALGAVAAGGLEVINEHVVKQLGISRSVIDEIVAREQDELERRERDYRADRPPPEVRGKTVLLIDDGLATGATMRVAARALRRMQPAELLIAVPIGAPQTCASFRNEADRIICARMPDPCVAVGYGYDDFSQTPDEEVRSLLAQAAMHQVNNSIT
jgi:putative phosphoribosyl transferase